MAGVRANGRKLPGEEESLLAALLGISFNYCSLPLRRHSPLHDNSVNKVKNSRVEGRTSLDGEV